MVSRRDALTTSRLTSLLPDTEQRSDPVTVTFCYWEAGQGHLQPVRPVKPSPGVSERRQRGRKLQANNIFLNSNFDF